MPDRLTTDGIGIFNKKNHEPGFISSNYDARDEEKDYGTHTCTPMGA